VRALAEQDEAVNGLAAIAQRQSTGLTAIARATAEQAGASEEIGQVSVQMRSQAKELTSAVGGSAKAIAAVAAEVASVAAEVARIRIANVQQVEAMAGITGALGEVSGLPPIANGGRVEKA
jgi:methyl-accepting chemotaxis protein